MADSTAAATPSLGRNRVNAETHIGEVLALRNQARLRGDGKAFLRLSMWLVLLGVEVKDDGQGTWYRVPDHLTAAQAEG